MNKEKVISGSTLMPASPRKARLAGDGSGKINVINTGADYGVISGGLCNTITAVPKNDFNTISGGYCNTISQPNGFIAGGAYNTVSGIYSSILGGNHNTVSHNYSAAFGSGVLSAADHTFHVECLNALNTPCYTGGAFPTGTIYTCCPGGGLPTGHACPLYIWL